MDKFTTDIVIGLEIHVELATASKLFCGCARTGSDEPNTRTCPVCLGHPGSKPVFNKKALEYALKLALALKCDISKEIFFSRKSYFYPDMSKNYQISQYEIPLAKNGKLKLKSGKEIRITRIHIEEDPASLVHQGSMQQSAFVLVDYNRSGDPLVEVVTEPDLTSPEEARDFMNRLITVLSYLNIFNQDNCIIKADANISIKESNYTRVEIKNITGFKEIEAALFHEVARQQKEVKEGKKLKQETRAWNTEQKNTFSLRSKETEEDYGYIIDPDLTKIEISDELIKKIDVPELAEEKLKKFIEHHKIQQLDAEVLAAKKELAELFEKVAEKVSPQLAAKWLRRELVRVMNYNNKTFENLEIDETHLVALLKLVEAKQITDKTAQKLMELLMEKPFDVNEYVKEHALNVVSDELLIEKVCKEVVQENPMVVEDYKKGSDKAINFLVGKVMQKTKGKASPKSVHEILKRLIQ
jgi:aspartyl-tRNA(Asn)/glutamyl-tRNA(Gln) amidotransferase subunit B